MDSVRVRDDGWEGDPIINLLFSGQGATLRVWIKTDQGKYIEPIGGIKIAFSTLEGCLPLYDPDTKTIFIG